MSVLKRCILSAFVLLAGFSLNAQNFSFAYLSDTHIAVGAESVKQLKQCIDDINENKELSFAIFAGDITEFGSDQELKLAKEIIDGLKIPYYIVAGNHDAKWSESGCNTFVKVFGYEEFDFEKEGIRFIGTNSGPNMRMAPALVPRETMVWLDSLSNAIDPKQPVFFINHFPMDTSVLNYTQVLDVLHKMNTQLIRQKYIRALADSKDCTSKARELADDLFALDLTVYSKKKPNTHPKITELSTES